MPLTLDDVITPTTADEVETEILSLASTAGLATTAWQEGSWARTIIEILSSEIATRALVDTEIARGGFGDFGSVEWVKLWAKDTYNVNYVPAAPATGTITATNSSATIYTLAAGDLIVAHETTGKTYRNQAPIVIPASSSLADIAISADEVGTSSDAAPGEITVVVSSLVGVTCINPAAVLGADEEGIGALVERARSKLDSLSPDGVKGAYNFVAKSPELSPTSSPITRSRTKGTTSGIVSVWIATATGTPTAGDVAIVQTGIETWAEPWCVQSTAIGATPVSIDITYAVWIRSSLTAAQVQAGISARLAEYLASIDIGGVIIPPASFGSIYAESLTHVIHTAYATTEHVVLTLPSGDVSLTDDQVAVLGTVLGTINFLT